MGLRPAWIQTSLRLHAVWSGSMLFAFSFSTCNRVCKRTAWILIRLRGCAGWSGFMPVTKALRWFCRDAAHLYQLSFCSSLCHFVISAIDYNRHWCFITKYHIITWYIEVWDVIKSLIYICINLKRCWIVMNIMHGNFSAIDITLPTWIIS
jgi:hypothetical protein